MSNQEQPSSGNTEVDWDIFKILCENPEMEPEDVDVTTALRSELAALQYKRDRLAEEINEMRGQMRHRDQRCLELQIEADQLREQAARQSAVIASLKKRISELEERERNLYASQGRNEIAIQTLQKDCKYHEERSRELEKKLRNIELELSSEEQKKETARSALHDFVRRLATALGTDVDEISHFSPEMVIHKASELVQETSRLRNKSSGLNDTLATIELELRSCKDNLERAITDKELLQRQTASQLLEIDRMRQEKEALEMQSRVQERELAELREKFSSSTRTVGSQSSSIAQLEATVCQLREELKASEERCIRLQNEQKNTLESMSMLLSTPSRFVESIESSIRDRIRELINENRDKHAQVESLTEKLLHESQQLSRQISLNDQANARIRSLEEEKNHLENRLHKLDSELNVCEHSREGLKRDRSQFMSFLQRLARALHMDDIAEEVGVELHTESLLLRAEQLARLESDKLVDKTAVVYQLQRRVRTLREQLQRKDLHLDLLRRKLALQEDCVKTKALLQSERDDANVRVKKLLKQVDKLTLQLSDAKDQIRDLNTQLAEAADYKIFNVLVYSIIPL
ncbi:coiled-coil domain-containing protein 170 [Agrilus planipennis]|uniref:Coiled-coil domain-containing protein 170 n=1 Tax=Agrilus planipennis TaxID=224129 RepID=A0A7F5R6C6_AGRPL|nr:coiled-coil domain-containing protein 170 [Agrilus planipennis]